MNLLFSLQIGYDPMPSPQTPPNPPWIVVGLHDVHERGDSMTVSSATPLLLFFWICMNDKNCLID